MKIRYTPLNEAAEIIQERKNNEEIQDKLIQLIGNSEPGGAYDLNQPEPVAVYAEYVARPTIADVDFARTALIGGLEPWWSTYTQDNFTTTNKKKVDMLRPPLVLPTGQQTRSWIVDAETRGKNNRGIGTYQTMYPALSVEEYWKRLRRLVLPRYVLGNYVENVTDVSQFYSEQANNRGVTGKSKAGAYYPSVMGMYAARAVLFVDFDKYPEFLPTAQAGYESAVQALGVEPVLVQFSSTNTLPALCNDNRELESRQTDLTFLTEMQMNEFKTA